MVGMLDHFFMAPFAIVAGGAHRDVELWLSVCSPSKLGAMLLIMSKFAHWWKLSEKSLGEHHVPALFDVDDVVGELYSQGDLVVVEFDTDFSEQKEMTL